MSLLGASNLIDLAYPAGIDVGELNRRINGNTSVTFADVIRNVAQGVALTNAEMMSHPIFGGMFSTTTRLDVTYPSGTPIATQERTESLRAQTSRMKEVGHMLNPKGYEKGFAFTDSYLQKADMELIMGRLGGELREMESTWQKNLLTRFFSNAENQINSSSGYDVGFADGNVSNITYVPPKYDGQSFASSHNHFDRQADSAAGKSAAIANGIDHLREHGIGGDYNAIIPLADVDEWAALNESTIKAVFVDYDRPVIRASTASDIGAPIADMHHVGYVKASLGTVHLWATSRVPTNYFGMYRDYGADNPRNPLLMWHDAAWGAGIRLARPITYTNPLQGLELYHDYAFGASEGRLNGYACLFAASGDYVVPTVS